MDDILASVQQELDQFLELHHTLQIASYNPNTHWPESSYAPFIRLDNTWYIYVSDLAQHSYNLMTHVQASVLLIESEDQAPTVFARKRVSMKVVVDEVSRGTDRFDFVLDVFAERFGGIISMLRGLTDFHLLALHPKEGVFVKGFAQAYVLSGDGMSVVSHIKDKGHGGTVTR